ncbi:hypothetical protein SEA_BUNKER_57 [Gordonia phage Bunker]|nr:hypothetical protein SEA_BUNKER_57 [Gordonia phage Bunker]
MIIACTTTSITPTGRAGPMTDRALGRMTMRHNTPRIKRRLQRSDRVAVTYTAEQFHHLLKQERVRGRKSAERNAAAAARLARAVTELGARTRAFDDGPKVTPKALAQRIVEAAAVHGRAVIVAGTGEHCREVFEEVLAVQTPVGWSRRDLYANYRPAGRIMCSLSADSCRGLGADTIVIIDALSDARERVLMPCLSSAASPQIWRPDVEFAARTDGKQ